MDLSNFPMNYLEDSFRTNTASALKVTKVIEEKVKLDILRFWRAVNIYKIAKLRNGVLEIKRTYEDLDSSCLIAIDSLSSISAYLVKKLGFSSGNENIERIESFVYILKTIRENKSGYDILLDKDYYKKTWLFSKEVLVSALDKIVSTLVVSINRSTGGAN